MIIPHAILKFTDYFSVDISDLVNHPFTCNYNVTLENSTFTVTMQSGSTFTFDALVVKIPKTDMLTYTYRTTSYYYLPNFDITFSGITCAIEIGADRRFQTAEKVYVGQLEQQQGTGLWDFTLIDTEPFVTITHYDVSDYATAQLAGTVAMEEFGNYREGFLMLSPFAFKALKLLVVLLQDNTHYFSQCLVTLLLVLSAIMVSLVVVVVKLLYSLMRANLKMLSLR